MTNEQIIAESKLIVIDKDHKTMIGAHLKAEVIKQMIKEGKYSPQAITAAVNEFEYANYIRDRSEKK